MKHRAATLLFCSVAAAAPWFAGAQCRIPGVLWILIGMMAVAGALVAVESRGFGGVPKILLVLVGVLALYLSTWLVGGEPAFQTAFSREQFNTVMANTPGGFVVPPWGQRLALIGACLLSVPALATIGRDAVGRNLLLKTIGMSGLLVALVAFLQRWVAFPVLPWLEIQGGTERWNAGFFHYSGTAACVNMAWPLVVFSRPARQLLGDGNWPRRLGVVALVGAVLAVSLAAAGCAVGIGLGVAGAAWLLLRLTALGRPKAVAVWMGIAMVAALGWQASEIQALKSRHPSRWTSASDTRSIADSRDAVFRQKLSRRQDRLVGSDAPIRPILWRAGLRMAKDHVLRGPGPGTWIQWSALYSNDAFFNTFFLCMQFTHHDLLQTAAEWGVVPAIVWLMLWAGALWRATKEADAADGTGYGLPLVLFGVAVHSLVDFPLQMPALQIWAAMLLGLAWSAGSASKPSRVRVEPPVTAESTRHRERGRRRRTRTPDPA